MKYDPLRPSILSMKIIPNVNPDMIKEFNLPEGHMSLGLFTSDCDDVSYTALDEATKKADVKVVYAKSFYGGAAKRQQKQREMSMARTMQSVEASTVLITNPTHIAIALRYEQGKDDAPVVMAKGLDYKAMKMKERAKEHDVPIIENKPLARAMYYEVEPGSSVPVELYQAVAEVLAVVFTMNQKKRK